MITTDTCPDCLEPAIEPVAERHHGPHVVHGYRCPNCQHQWATARLRTAYPVGEEAA